MKLELGVRSDLPPVTIVNPNFRPNTETHIKEVVFDMKMPNARTAAMGDMIAWMPAIKYIAENYNYVWGHLITPHWFLDIAANILRPYPHWRVHSKIPDRLAVGFPLKQPTEHPINATGMHLVDLGFVYFAHINPVPEGADEYPMLDLDDVPLKKELSGVKYAVMTPGSTANTRTMPAGTYNKICDHLLAKGIVPVHVGVNSMDNGIRPVVMEQDYDFSKGINLIDKTSLLEAAKVLDNAEMVLGIDNGLLHLAAMTKTTIIFGYTIVGPTHRRPKRATGRTYELHGDKAKLPCLFCQERVRFFFDHNFTNCIYKLNLPDCIKVLNPESWCATIDMALGE